jgi:hypothetical protein
MRDRDVRAALLSDLRMEHADGATRIVEEMGLLRGGVRVDVAVINGELSGFEIKSPADTLQRLPRQQQLYSRIFDKAWLVTSEDQRRAAERLVPAWWGFIEVTCHHGKVALHVERLPSTNPYPDASAIAALLWRDEALQLLANREADRGVRGKSCKHVWKRLVDTYHLDELQAAVRTVLKDRQNWLPDPSDRLPQA